MSGKLPTWQMEHALVQQGAQWIIGLDEVGRGCLAGPVTLGAAAFNCEDVGGELPQDLKDSKLLSEKKRESLFPKLLERVPALATGECSNHEIDEQGINYCLGLAAVKAIARVEEILLDSSTDKINRSSRIAVLLDGPVDYITPVLHTFDVPQLPIVPRIYTLVKADQKCVSVASASVFAKVTRDREMIEIAKSHSGFGVYGWETNKGYGSATHRQAIKDFGVTSYHRLSWHLV